MKLFNLIPLKEITKKELDKERQFFIKNMGGAPWENALKEIDKVLGDIDHTYGFDSNNKDYDYTKEYDAVSSSTYNYFLPHLAIDDANPEKVKNSIDKLNKLYSKKLDDRYKELKNQLETATKNLKNKIK